MSALVSMAGGAALQVDPVEVRYFTTLEAGTFEIPYCTECGRWHFFPRVCCPYCHSERLQWRQPSGMGTVYSTTTVRKPPDSDYCVCLVNLDEGPRLMSTVVGIDPTKVRIGDRVQAQIRRGDRGALLVFLPAGNAI